MYNISTCLVENAFILLDCTEVNGIPVASYWYDYKLSRLVQKSGE